MQSDLDDRIEGRGLLAFPSGDCVILAENYDSELSNLRCVNAHGGLRWYAPLPMGKDDIYVSAEIKNGRLFANSWSCYRVELSLNDGSILTEKFTK